jgi:NTE family protein
MSGGLDHTAGAAQGISLALSGGGARSIAHIGVLGVLAREGIPVARVAGTSGGGLIAVLFAAGYPVADLIKDARGFEWRRLAQLRPHPLGIMATERLGEFVTRRIGERRFEELRIPCAVVAADLTTCAKRVFDSGPVTPAVRATCAIPEFYRPVELDGHTFIDGGIVEPLPVSTVLGLGVGERPPCVAVNLLRTHPTPESPRHPLQLLGRMSELVQQELTRLALASADVFVAPDVGEFSFFDLENADGLMAAGEAAMLHALPRLLEILQDRA